jgi:hypothetical protein
MATCSFCGATEKIKSPLCQACGALKYPIQKKYIKNGIDKYKKLKTSVLIAATVFTPGSLIILTILGARRISSKIKRKKYTP